ncbi:MAG: hypothetical protein NT115_00255 [Proteobacteria bacterium]|nr:hypothetical protein [Pseudomonadota bacterium]
MPARFAPALQTGASPLFRPHGARMTRTSMVKVRPKQQQMRQRIAAAAARMMAEDGIADFALAKRKAARQLGAIDTQVLPGNGEIEVELKNYLSLYQGEEQRERLVHLRQVALSAMQALASFRPYLTGAVLKGTAGRYADIELQLFTDDGKAVELYLLNRSIPYETSAHRHYAGDQLRAVTVLQMEWEDTPVSLAVFTTNDERSALKSSAAGRTMERAGIDAVAALVAGID